MTGLLAQLGKSLAERWIALLVLPGLLWIAAATCAYRLGHAHALDPRWLAAWLDRIAAVPPARRTTVLVLFAAGAVPASAGAGLAAGALGGVLERLWTASGAHPPMAWILHVRQRRWTAVRDSARRRIDALNSSDLTGRKLDRARAAARRAERRRLARPSQPPQLPTRIAERFHASAVRADTLYGLDLNLAWPRLWTVLPDGLRTDLTAARDSYAAAARLFGWGLLYTALAVLWWPAVVLGAATAVAAAMKARTAADLLGDLVDTATDLHLTELSDRLAAAAPDRPTPETGGAITRRLTRPHDPAASAPVQRTPSAAPAAPEAS
ncbi:hypothetical protein [Kitasatospora indigofera]|uniref:hypothetical protein n=1 Tax=Kitasatospora indigofera TaxID=67307 RepID=UPI0033A0A987